MILEATVTAKNECFQSLYQHSIQRNHFQAHMHEDILQKNYLY